MPAPIIISSAKLAAVKFAKDRAKEKLKRVAKEKSQELISENIKRVNRGLKPNGSTFQPLAESTLEQKTNGKILQESGRMIRSNQHSVRTNSGGEKNVTEIRNDTPYAIYHQRGTLTMPARPLLGVSDNDIKNYSDRLTDQITDSIFK